MRAVQVDAANKRARVEPGATLADVDRETQKFGLAIPTGINSTTGIAGLTLGGGFGWLSRKFGLTIDSLLSADVITASGEQLRASSGENPDLFWALRGGGGNFGVVTSFEFQLHEAGPEVLSGLVVHPFRRTPARFSRAIGKPLKQRRRADLLGRDAEGAAAAVPAAPNGTARKCCFSPSAIAAIWLRARRRRRAALDWKADRRCGWPAPVHGLAAGIRPAARSGRAQLLEKPRFRGAFRHRHRNPYRRGEQAAGPGMRDLHRPCGRSRWPHRAGRYRFPAKKLALRRERACALARARAGPAMHLLGAAGLFEAAKPHAIGTAYINFMPGDEQTASRRHMAATTAARGDQAALRSG